MVTSCFAFFLLSACLFLIDVKKWWNGAPFFYPGDFIRIFDLNAMRGAKKKVFYLTEFFKGKILELAGILLLKLNYMQWNFRCKNPLKYIFTLVIRPISAIHDTFFATILLFYIIHDLKSV